jgi:pimeloyl-ACP methyl ester carboxylesterase
MDSKLFARLFQPVFFPGKRGPAKLRWRQQMQDLAPLRDIVVYRDGRRLTTVQLSPPNEPVQGCAILAHPVSRRGKFFFSDFPCTPIYLARGFDVVAFDFNGFGEAQRNDFFYWKDTAQIIDTCRARMPTSRFIIHGVSFGAFHIIRALPHLPNGSLVILENVSRTLYDYWKRWWYTGVLVRLFLESGIEAAREMDVLACLREFDRPDISYLFIGCEQDTFTPVAEMRDLFEALPTSRKTFVTFQRAGHLGAGTTEPVRYSELLSAFASSGIPACGS